jgi:hypothetical protein
MKALTFFLMLSLVSPYTLEMVMTLLLQINGLKEFKKPGILLTGMIKTPCPLFTSLSEAKHSNGMNVGTKWC